MHSRRPVIRLLFGWRPQYLRVVWREDGERVTLVGCGHGDDVVKISITGGIKRMRIIVVPIITARCDEDDAAVRRVSCAGDGIAKRVPLRAVAMVEENV